MQNFLSLTLGPGALERQRRQGSRELYDTASTGLDRLSPEEIGHVRAAQHFYMATVNEDGWPYVQHRGGEVGFVHQLGPSTIGWAERLGNRQYIGTGNLAAGGRISMIFVDYPARTRLKLVGSGALIAEPDDELLATVGASDIRHDGVVVVDVLATAWNCPKYIEPRFTADQVNAAVAPLQARIIELEARLAEHT